MITDTLKTLDRWVGLTCKYVAVALFLALFFLLLSSIFLRLMPIVNIVGYDEIVELLFIWIVMIAAIALWREGALYRVTMLDGMMGPKVRFGFALVIHSAMLVFAVIMAWYGWLFAVNAMETTPFLRVSKFWWFVAIPFAGAFMTIYSVAWLWRIISRREGMADSEGLLS